MWNVLPKFGVIKGLMVFFSAILIFILTFFLTPGKASGTFSYLISTLKFSTSLVFIFLLFVYAMGKWGWQYVWDSERFGRTLNAAICPNLNGHWVAEITSNFAENARRIGDVVITADMFSITMELRSDDNYQQSKVTYSQLYKDPRTNAFYLTYLFEGFVPNPAPTDDKEFNGAAKLLISVEADEIEMAGTYWTDRAWQRKLNTAGTIKLKRNRS